jgi:catechol 2,3-dioxygenase-like lactoylglutathione lyase family enzyme
MQSSVNVALRLHHVGIVVPVIEESRAFYIDVLHYRESTPIIHDPVQTAFVQFFSIPGSDHYLELVAPDGAASKLQKASQKGPPLNHLCYSCEAIASTVSFLQESGCFVIQKPVSAVAFDGRPIAWVMSPDGLLIELVEGESEGSLFHKWGSDHFTSDR